MHSSRDYQGVIKKKKKAFLNEQCKEREGSNKMGKTRDVFNRIGDIKGKFHARMGMIKDKNRKDLTEAEEIKRWQAMGIRCMAQENQTGALYKPRGVGWGGRWEGDSRWRGHMYTYG